MSEQTGETDAMAWAFSDAARWLTALADDGPDLRVRAHVKAAHEAEELAHNPSPEEWADVAICLVGAALGQGWTLGELAEAVRSKVVVNAAQTWVQTSDGTWQHDPALRPAQPTLPAEQQDSAGRGDQS